jgi:hypothetical protein
MSVHLYLSLIPEALIASMLEPSDFGAYYAVGTHKKLHGQAIFIELDPHYRHEFFRIDEGISRCVPHATDGTPKKSVYISTYRVLEHVPRDAMQQLFLVSAYGETLGLDLSEEYPDDGEELHMYQELAPVQPLVVSAYGPRKFYEFITQNPESMIHLPAIAFVELRLGALAKEPEFGEIGELPYDFIPHLRECLLELHEKTIDSKMVDRVHPVEFPFRMIKSGIFVGNREALCYYPLPTREELRGKYFRWWRSANLV